MTQKLRSVERSTLAAVLLLAAISLVSGCTKAKSQSPISYLPGQPGTAALEKLAEQNISELHNAQTLLQDLAETKAFGRMLNTLPDAASEEAAKLVLLMSNGRTVEEAAVQLVNDTDDEKQMGYAVKSALLLFPLQQNDLYRYLQKNLDIRRTLLDKWASDAGLLTEQTMPDADEDGVFIQPLIESASISVFDVSENVRGAIQFKAAGSDTWQAGRDLIWEPVSGALTGPVVFLQADTTYDVKITLTEEQQLDREITRQFTTRADKPVIDPEKVYQLSDIYRGGTLDLEALGIEGSPDGYAKIVGDANTVITPDDDDKYAVFVGDNSYIYFENVTVKGARVHAFYGEKAHDIWLNNCDISGWGRAPNIMKNGIAYELEGAQPINYDSAIYFRQSGVITVENCRVHDPRAIANDWSVAHPKGPNAFLAHGNHPDPRFKGQIIVRNNHFYGAPDHRFNDVIEGRKNGEALGGFVRDSAVYGNTLEYSNDDAIEVDGGQRNVLVYNNDISHTYSGISVTPVRVGPSFIFNNYIHDLGDQQGKQWASIKMGGLLTGPVGQSVLLHNLITTERNGITASRFQEDNTFWTYVQNNVIIMEKDNNQVGFDVYDPQAFSGSQYVNNYFFNLAAGGPKVDANITMPYVFSESRLNPETAQSLFTQGKSVMLPKCDKYRINNFTQRSEDGTQAIYGIVGE